MNLILKKRSGKLKIPNRVDPNESIVMDLVFIMPNDYKERVWHLDLVSQGNYWFSDRGTKPMELTIE